MHSWLNVKIRLMCVGAEDIAAVVKKNFQLTSDCTALYPRSESNKNKFCQFVSSSKLQIGYGLKLAVAVYIWFASVK
jgi:hypothetical protein